jgi:hypothetical protein
MAWIIYKLSPRFPNPPVTGQSGRVYRFHPRGINNWGMEDVDERDVDTVLNAVRGCCGSRGKFFRLATPEEVEAWEQNKVYHRRRR